MFWESSLSATLYFLDLDSPINIPQKIFECSEISSTWICDDKLVDILLVRRALCVLVLERSFLLKLWILSLQLNIFFFNSEFVFSSCAHFSNNLLHLTQEIFELLEVLLRFGSKDERFSKLKSKFKLQFRFKEGTASLLSIFLPINSEEKWFWQTKYFPSLLKSHACLHKLLKI